MADIVYWYRPTEVRDEKTGKITYKKKFRDKDFLQKSYADICNKFNCSEKQVRESLKHLENLGVIQRHFKAVMTGYGKLPNIMFLELFPETLKKLTFPNGNTCFPLGKDRVPNLDLTIPDPYDPVCLSRDFFVVRDHHKGLPISTASLKEKR